MAIDDLQLRKYLLGAVDEAVEAEIGLQLIADEKLGERLDHAENELVEDYLDGLLSADEVRLFRDNFLATPHRHHLLQEVRAVRAAVRQVGTSNPAEPTAASESRAEPAKTNLFSFFFRPVVAVGLLFIFIAGFAAWFVLVRDGRTPLEMEYAALNARELGEPATASKFLSVSLVHGSMRDASSTATVQTSKLTDSVLFRLAMRLPETEAAELGVALEKSGKRIFSLPNARIFINPYGSELQFLAPRQILTAGDYQIKITAPDSRNDGTVYQFTVD